MNGPSSRIPTAVVLLTGVALGWAFSSLRPTPLRPGGGDRSGEYILATGPAIVRYDEGAKAPIPLDAVYFLDYKAGRAETPATLPPQFEMIRNVMEALAIPVVEAPGYGMTILDYDPGSRGALSYLDASRELAVRGGSEQAQHR